MTASNLNPVQEHLPAHLVAGYSSFTKGRLPEQEGRFRHLAEVGQKPPVLLIGCCDSRVAPEVIFDAGPGEVFVMRNIGALVPPFQIDDPLPETAAAIEYAVLALKVSHIVVMGHAQCGGIYAFARDSIDKFEPLSEANFIAKWTRLIEPAAKRIGPVVGDFDDYCKRLSYASIIQSVGNLRTYPGIAARVAAGSLTLHGACFGATDGSMTVLDQASGTFVPVISATN